MYVAKLTQERWSSDREVKLVSFITSHNSGTDPGLIVGGVAERRMRAERATLFGWATPTFA